MFVWESDDKKLFQKLNVTQFVKRNIETLGKKMYPPSLTEALLEGLEGTQLIFQIFYTFVCIFGWVAAVHRKKIYRKIRARQKGCLIARD